MNERINELRKQAGDFASETYSKYTMATFDTNKSIETLFEEKFVELIIKEYEQFLPEYCPWSNADENGPMKGWHVAFVARKHFGVEE